MLNNHQCVWVTLIRDHDSWFYTLQRERIRIFRRSKTVSSGSLGACFLLFCSVCATTTTTLTYMHISLYKSRSNAVLAMTTIKKFSTTFLYKTAWNWGFSLLMLSSEKTGIMGIMTQSHNFRKCHRLLSAFQSIDGLVFIM